MALRVLDVDLAETTGKLVDIVRAEAGAVRQQQVIELLVLSHATRMDTLEGALMVADGINKHVRQLIKQQFEEFRK